MKFYGNTLFKFCCLLETASNIAMLKSSVKRRREKEEKIKVKETTSNNIKEVLALYGMAHLCPQVINKVMMIHSMHIAVCKGGK